MNEDRPNGSSSRLFFVVMVVGALVFGLALGFKLGSESETRVAGGPTTPPSATPALTPAPIATPETTPIPDSSDQPDQPSFAPPLIGYAFVADELKQAYYGGGAGTSVCDVSATPICHTRRSVIEVPDVDPNAAGFRELFRAGPIENVTTGAIVVVQDGPAVEVHADLYSESSLPFGLPVVAVNPDGQGIFYMDLSAIDNGRSVLVIRRLEETDEGLQYANNVIAFDLSRPE